MGNLVRKVFSSAFSVVDAGQNGQVNAFNGQQVQYGCVPIDNFSSTFTPPAGVTSVQVQTIYNNRRFDSCAQLGGTINSSGQLYTWGLNTNGELGNGTAGGTNVSSPIVVPGGFIFAKIFSPGIGAESSYSMGITSTGVLYAWGSGAHGEIGNSTTSVYSSPVLVAGGITWSNIMATSTHIYGLATNGNLYAWGSNASGILGVNSTTSAFSSPVLVSGGLTFATYGMTSQVGIGLTTSGAIYMWGFGNSDGRFGNNTTSNYSSPVLVVGGLSWANFCCVGANTLAITTTGVLYGWGQNTNSQLGIGNSVNQSSPVAVLGGLTWISFIASASCNFGISTNNQLYAWGTDFYGVLGQGTGSAGNSYSSPQVVVGGISFVSVYTDASSAYGLTAAGTLYAWGRNQNGQLGDGTTSSRSSPVLVVGGLNFTSFYIDSQIATTTRFAITTTGQLYSWGQNNNGNAGVGTSTAFSSPVLVVGGLSWVAVRIWNQGNNAMGITTTGQLYSWGLGTGGENGNATTSTYSSPVLVVGGLAPNLGNTSTFQTFQVIPGVAIPIVANQNFTTFGGAIISQVPVDKVIVTFEQ